MTVKTLFFNISNFCQSHQQNWIFSINTNQIRHQHKWITRSTSKFPTKTQPKTRRSTRKLLFINFPNWFASFTSPNPRTKFLLILNIIFKAECVKIDHTQTRRHTCMRASLFWLLFYLSRKICVWEKMDENLGQGLERKEYIQHVFHRSGGAFYDSNTHILPLLRCNLPCYAVHFYLLFLFFIMKKKYTWNAVE